ncbi:hypothetical protein [Grimontia hollisae]|nr:hypothetical protein [Grimontia hollisae]
MEVIQVTVEDFQFFAHVMMGLNVVTVFTGLLAYDGACMLLSKLAKRLSR